MYTSTIKQVGEVKFPVFAGDKIYMRKFYKKDGLPEDINRWQGVVDAMLETVDTDGPIFIMVDEDRVLADTTHRRHGIHIDGNWNEEIQCHGQPSPPTHGFTDLKEEGLILASNVTASAAYCGNWSGDIGEDGDCSTVGLSGLTRTELQKGKIYAGNVTMLHESIPVLADCKRTLVRLNVPNYAISH